MPNQEILFRGFHPCKGGDMIIYVEGKVVKGRWIEGLPHKEWLCDGSYKLNIQSDTETNNGSLLFDVIPYTVGQYTGLTDKNGVKIFEWDIILANFPTPFTVVWDNEGCRFLGTQPNDGSRHFTASDKYICYLSDAQEVIGTIFDKRQPHDSNKNRVVRLHGKPRNRL